MKYGLEVAVFVIISEFLRYVYNGRHPIKRMLQPIRKFFLIYLAVSIEKGNFAVRNNIEKCSF